MRKVAIIGGGGVRTPLLIYGLAQSQELLKITELTLFDLDEARTRTIARIGREIVRQMGAGFQIRDTSRLDEAAEGADFVLSSIRVGGMAARARDERVAIEHGLAGQETTGPAGAAMALRTLPVTLGHAKVIERVAPGAWFVNFTNPAGLITQALTRNTSLKLIGICDTPSELFHKIADRRGSACRGCRVRLCRAESPRLGATRPSAGRGNHAAAARRRHAPAQLVSGRPVRSGAYSDAAAHPDRVPVLLLQPAKGIPESAQRRGQPRRGAAANESRPLRTARRPDRLPRPSLPIPATCNNATHPT